MKIEQNPVLDKGNLTLKVSYNIDTNEPSIIMMNGLIALTDDDYDISDDTITLKEDYGIDFDNDTLCVIYTILD